MSKTAVHSSGQTAVYSGQTAVYSGQTAVYSSGQTAVYSSGQTAVYLSGIMDLGPVYGMTVLPPWLCRASWTRWGTHSHPGT